MSGYNKEFEKKVQDSFLDGFYKKLGYEIEKRCQQEFGEWDVILKKGDRKIRVEEKIIRNVWSNIVVELIEDMASGKQGWYFQLSADWLMEVFCENEVPQVIYCLNWPEFKKWYADNCHRFKLTDRDGQVEPAIRIDKTGWGVTMFHLIPIEMISKGIIKKLYEKK